MPMVGMFGLVKFAQSGRHTLQHQRKSAGGLRGRRAASRRRQSAPLHLVAAGDSQVLRCQSDAPAPGCHFVPRRMSGARKAPLRSSQRLHRLRYETACITNGNLRNSGEERHIGPLRRLCPAPRRCDAVIHLHSHGQGVIKPSIVVPTSRQLRSMGCRPRQPFSKA